MTNTEVSMQGRLITGEELAQMADLGPCDLIDGRIVPMTPAGGRHGRIELNFARALDECERSRHVGAARTVYVYRSVTDVREFGETDRLQGDHILPGFDVPVASRFEQ